MCSGPRIRQTVEVPVLDPQARCAGKLMIPTAWGANDARRANHGESGVAAAHFHHLGGCLQSPAPAISILIWLAMWKFMGPICRRTGAGTP